MKISIKSVLAVFISVSVLVGCNDENKAWKACDEAKDDQVKKLDSIEESAWKDYDQVLTAIRAAGDLRKTSGSLPQPGEGSSVNFPNAKGSTILFPEELAEIRRAESQLEGTYKVLTKLDRGWCGVKPKNGGEEYRVVFKGFSEANCWAGKMFGDDAGKGRPLVRIEATPRLAAPAPTGSSSASPPSPRVHIAPQGKATGPESRAAVDTRELQPAVHSHHQEPYGILIHPPPTWWPIKTPRRCTLCVRGVL